MSDLVRSRLRRHRRLVPAPAVRRRLETLWELAAAAASADDAAFLRTLLRAGLVGLGVEHDFHGALCRVEGAEFVVEAEEVPYGELDLPPGMRLSRHSLHGEIVRQGRTHSAVDLASDPYYDDHRTAWTKPWRTFVGTPFRSGVTTYTLCFASLVEASQPFSAEDHAYVETLASLCATRLHQRGQIDRLRHQAAHDSLTGIANRATFRSMGAAALREGGSHAVAVLDLDRFRGINDTLGHQCGDAVLVEVAAMLASRAGDDLVARTGGDEFAILMRDVRDRRDVEQRVLRYREGFAQPFGLGDREGRQHARVTASFGIAIAPEDAETFEQLLSRADAAVAAAKLGGRARWAFFDRAIEHSLQTSGRFANELASAIARNELVLHFQPQVEPATGRIAGVEALVRWQHPERGLLLPREFLPFAQDHGLMSATGAWVMRETVARSRAWRRHDPSLTVWFNVSAVEVADPGFLCLFSETDDDLHGIGIEIGETDAMHDIERTARTLAAIRDAGVSIALDDFGSGSSSLAGVKRLPLDVLKIDAGIVAGVPGDRNRGAVVDAVVAVARSFGLRVFAEGVETAEQFAWLRDAGCDVGQGFYFTRPIPVDGLESWLAVNSSSRG